MESTKMQMMDQKIKKFKEFMDDFVKDFDAGYLSYNMWQSQHENLRILNQRLIDRNKEAEDQFNRTVAATEELKAQGKREMAKTQAEIMVLWTKATAKYKEVERLLDEMDKKRIKEHLRHLESKTAA